VERNRVKRRLREIMRRQLPEVDPPADLVLVATPRAAGASYDRLEAEALRLLRTCGLLR
jgi:ribonuclease P protein component